MILSKFVLFNLKIEELIALCCYYDIDWHTYINYNNKITKIITNELSINKLLLIDNLYYYFLNNKLPNKIIFKYVSYKKEKLYYDSLVLYGQFNKNNYYCYKLMKDLDISFNNQIYNIVYNYWKLNIPLTYIQLKRLSTLRSRSFNYNYNRKYALKEYFKFIDNIL